MFILRIILPLSSFKNCMKDNEYVQQPFTKIISFFTIIDQHTIGSPYKMNLENSFYIIHRKPFNIK